MRRLGLVLLAVLPTAVAYADPPAPSPFEGQVPKAEGLVLDGKLDEDAWKTALAIPAEDMEGVKAEVKVLVGGGCLWVSAKVAEDPGFAMGIRWMICPDKTVSAADAVALAYAPQDLRCPEFTVRGPRGSGRKVYRFDGRADVSQAGVWTIETCLALADLALPAGDTPIRLAVAVTGRTPNHLSSAPPDSAFHSPAAFALLRPPAGGWGADHDPGLVGLDLSNRDATDRERLTTWDEFQGARAGPHPPGDTGWTELQALEHAIRARPDLLMLRVAKGDVHRAHGRRLDALGEYEGVLHAAPGLREAQWSIDRSHVDYVVHPIGGHNGSDYAQSYKWIAVNTREGTDKWAACKGILDFRRGDFAEAARELSPVAATHAFDEEIVVTARWAKEWAGLWGHELASRKADGNRDDLPRVRIKTAKGPIVLELFEDAAPNTVKNFVWLAEALAYDDTKFDQSAAFQRIEGGEPEKPAARWTIRTEASKRKPFRGTVAMANEGIDTEWARFFITTGTLPEVDGQVTVFGRVLEGQDVVDHLVAGDTIAKVEVVRKRPNVDYRPITVSGTPARPPR